MSSHSERKTRAIALHRAPEGTSRPCRVRKVVPLGRYTLAEFKVQGEPLRYTVHFGPGERVPAEGDGGTLVAAAHGWRFVADGARAPEGQGVADG